MGMNVTSAYRWVAGTAMVVLSACNPSTIGEPRSPVTLSVQTAAIVANAKASITVYAANGAVIHKKAVGAVQVDEARARQLVRDTHTAKAATAAMPSFDEGERTRARERPEAMFSRIATRLSVAATEKQQLMNPTGRATFTFKSKNGHKFEVERSGSPASPDTLATLKQDGVIVLSTATSWIKVADGWVAQQVRSRVPMGGGGTIETTLVLSDWTGGADLAEAAPEGVTRVHSTAAFCSQDDIDWGNCYWDDWSGGWELIEDLGPICNVLRWAASMASTAADIAINAKLDFHYDVHLPACDANNPVFILGQCNNAYDWCMGLTATMNAAVSAEADCWQAYYNRGCGAW